MLIIPNSTDTTGGNKYAALDQAEPDALDFEVLGNTGFAGVAEGLAVTSNSNQTVNVAAGVIAVDGTVYSVAASPTLALGTPPVDNRYDLIVARVASGVASLVVIPGNDDSDNPTYPRSKSVLTGAFVPSTHVDLTADVVIAAVYRTGSTTITTSRIIDKRAMLSSGIVRQGTTAPDLGDGSGPGNLYFKTDTDVDEVTSSGVYVRLSGSQGWVGLAKDVGLHVPVGAEIGWPTAAPVPANFAEPTGQSLATATYPDLFAVYGYENGGSGGTFLMPDHRGVHLRVTSNTAIVGDSLGADSVTISEAQLPIHAHTIAHTHPFVHEHTITHGHPGSSTGAAGAHQHSPGTLSITGSGGRNIAFREPPPYPLSGAVYVTGYLLDVPPESYPYPLNGGMVLTNSLDVLVTTGLTSTAPAHDHTNNVATYTGSTSAQSTSTTGPTSTATSGNVGSGAPLSVIPASKYTRHIIRVS